MDIKEMINLLVEKSKDALSGITVIFLANVKDLTSNPYNYSDSSILTEFLSIEEFNELLTSLQDFGFYTLEYFNS